MSTKNWLASAYYTVASDLEREGREMLEMAEALNAIADRLSEEAIREGESNG